MCVAPFHEYDRNNKKICFCANLKDKSNLGLKAHQNLTVKQTNKQTILLYSRVWRDRFFPSSFRDYLSVNREY